MDCFSVSLYVFVSVKVEPLATLIKVICLQELSILYISLCNLLYSSTNISLMVVDRCILLLLYINIHVKPEKHNYIKGVENVSL